MIDVGFVRAIGAGVAEAIFRLVAFGDSQGALSILENISAKASEVFELSVLACPVVSDQS